MNMASLKLTIEVVAGIVPGTPMPEYTRRWHWTSQDQRQLSEGKAEARERWIAMAGESREYAASLEDPARINWVRRDWLWW